MANEFTSILTGGLSDNTVKTMYDFAFGMVLREEPMYRTWADKGVERPNGPGQSIILNKVDYFGTAAIEAAKTPLNEEQDVDSTKLPPTIPVTLTVNEYGFAVTKTKKLRLFSFADVDAIAARSVAAHHRDVMDELVQDKLMGGTQVLYAGNATATANVDATDTIDGNDIRKAFTKLSTNKAQKWGGFYACGIHPHVVFDLRTATGQNEWRLPHEYAAGNQTPLWTGELGEFEGLRFVQNTRTRKDDDGASSAVVYRTFVQGREALAERVVEEPNVVLGPVTDKLQRFRTVGWYGILGWVIYRDEALYRIESGSSVSTL